MFDLYSLEIPSSKESLQGFVNYLDEILSILDIFEEHCLTFAPNEGINESLKKKALSQE